MKNLQHTLMLLVAVTAAATLFSSCDEDQMTSNNLTGDWKGDFGMYYNFSYGHRVYTFESYDTDLSFVPEYDYAKHGYGYQVDHYDFGPYERIYHYFTWYVEHQNIYMRYCDEVELNTVIYRYRMSDSQFTGYFDDSTTKFRLYKIADYYDWGSYADNGCDYYYYDRYDWHAPAMRSAGMDEEGVSANEPLTEGCDAGEMPQGIISYGNRFADRAKAAK